VGRIVGYAVAAVFVVLLLFATAAAGVVGAIFEGGAAGGGCTATLRDPAAIPAGLTAEQAANAGVIVGVGQRTDVPARGWVIAVATALQESDLINTSTANDHDSLGLFAQRPSQGWGTPQQILDPPYAATAFYTRLLRVPAWQTLPLTVAAQQVQKSAYPDAYAKHEAQAAAIVAAYTGGTVCDGGDTGGNLANLPSGYTLPPDTPAAVVVAIRWALAQVGTPYTFGGDCTAPHSGVSAHQCDCSSLVQAAYRAGGLSLPRTTGQQVHAGTPVAGLAEVRPGDLIFIPGSDGTAANPGHVGMAIGSGLLIQAPHTGTNVRVNHITDWASEVADIRRIVPS
jgi:cell wall-associated NlpC family hydrolase